MGFRVRDTRGRWNVNWVEFRMRWAFGCTGGEKEFKERGTQMKMAAQKDSRSEAPG